MSAASWETTARRRLDASRSKLTQEEQELFRDWMRDPPDPPIDRWKKIEEAYSSLDLSAILGRREYCHDFVRDALRFYLHHIVYCEEHTKQYEEHAIGLAQLINFVYYAEKRAKSEEGILNEVLDAVISTISKFPRWIKVDVLAKVICTGCPIYVAVRLFNGFDSASEPLPRSLLQSAAFTKDHFYMAAIQEGYSVATRIVGWGSNRLSNLGCHDGSSVDQKNMITLPKFGGYRVTAFSVGINHSLFLTENRQLWVTGRLKNWTGKPYDERFALTPVEVEFPEEFKRGCIVERFNSPGSLPNLQCRRIYAGTNRSEIIFATDIPLTKNKKWHLVRIIAGLGLRGAAMEPSMQKSDERWTAGEPSHIVANDRYNLHSLDEIPPIRFKGSKKNRLDLDITVDDQGGLLVSDVSSKSLPRELRLCVGDVVHRPHSIRQTAFCDNGDVFSLLQVDRMARNYTLVKGEIRRLRVDQMEWTSKKANKEKKEEQYYLVAEQVSGAEHVVQFSVDRKGDNLLFETRDQPRTLNFRPFETAFHTPFNTLEDPEVCYGGATRSLELLQRERDRGNVIVDQEELIKLSPHSNLLCPRPFLSEEQMNDLKEESPIEMRSEKRKKKKNGLSESQAIIYHLHDKSRRAVELSPEKNEKIKIVPIPDRYYGASFENGSLRVAIPRYLDTHIDMMTKQYEDTEMRSMNDMIACYIADLFPFVSPSAVKVCVTGRSEAYTLVTLRPEISFGSLYSEARLRGFKMLKVIYNGEYEFEIAENLWELHTPHFNRSQHFDSTAVVQCLFPEGVMRMCERAFIDPSSTENYSVNQLLHMLDVADYLCANLLAEDVIYRLLRNATRSDINSILGDIALMLNSRSSLIAVLSRFPHILIDWPIELDEDCLFEACERMQVAVGPVPRVIKTSGSSTIPSHCNLSLFILASPNCELAVGLNDLPLSTESCVEIATNNIFTNLPSEDTILNLIDRRDRLSLLFDSFKGEKGLAEKCKMIFEECNARYDQGGQHATMNNLQPRISIDLETFLTTVPPPNLNLTPVPKKATIKRIRRRTERRSEREGERREEMMTEEEGRRREVSPVNMSSR
ncbi:hypothetical protein PENTCL1PPCAC_11776, partial [Pristionchus entomophagus]